MNVHSTTHASTAHAAPPAPKPPRPAEKPPEHGSDDAPRVKVPVARDTGSMVDKTV